MTCKLIKWATILSLVFAGGCNITSTSILNLNTLDVDNLIQEVEKDILNQTLSEEDRTDESLEIRMKTGSCQEALFSYLLKVGQPDETKRATLPPKFPADAASKNYAPSNPNKCDDVDVEKMFSDLLLQQNPPSFVFPMPSPSTTGTEQELNPTMQQCLDLMNDPTFLKVVDFRLKMVTDSPKIRSNIKVLPEGKIYAVKFSAIKGADWRPSKEKVNKLEKEGVLQQIAETKAVPIDGESSLELQIAWLPERKRIAFDNFVAREVGLLLVTEGLAFERLPKEKEDGRELLGTPSGKINLRAEVDISIQTRVSHFNCASIIFQALQQ